MNHYENSKENYDKIMLKKKLNAILAVFSDNTTNWFLTMAW